MRIYNKENALKKVLRKEEIFWINKPQKNLEKIFFDFEIQFKDIIAADNDMLRFSNLIKKIFPETLNGIIESNLLRSRVNNNLFFKCDNELPVAGSIKARGGFYEILKFCEKIAKENGFNSKKDDYSVLSDAFYRKIFSKYTIVVGSTGNLGLSIGLVSSKLGFKCQIHMSKDAKEWKKDLLRRNNVEVIEYNNDYSYAVKKAREISMNKDFFYFIDDENSKLLFIGYAIAVLRLKKQLMYYNIKISKNNPLNVYIPCGVGGAPAGINYGLKHLFGNEVFCYYIEPIQTPCMLLGLLTKKYENVNIKNFGLDGQTNADGLAVSSPSKLVSKLCDEIVDGIITFKDSSMFECLQLLNKKENIKVEPSAASSLIGYKRNRNISGVHICWLTGGNLVPENVYNEYF